VTAAGSAEHAGVGPGRDVPAVVRDLTQGDRVTLVWENEAGGLTFQLGGGHGADRRFVKWVPAELGIDLTREAARLLWAARYTSVPRVLDRGADDAGSWLLTAGLPGRNAVDGRWRAAPGVAVAALGCGLRALHDALPVASCPYSWSVADRLTDVRARAAAGRLDPTRWHPEHRGHTVASALAALADAPDVDVEVVCHGDACAPNTLLADDGRVSGHVDLGDLGTADRWADLAVATWSAGWNYGPSWEGALLDAYGVDPDPERTAYYRLLWDLGP